MGPSSEFPQRHCGTGRAKTKSLHRGRFRSNPTVPDDRQTAQPRAERTSVEGPPEHHGDGLKASPELAARKTADIRPTALREGQIAKARRVLGRRSRVTNSKEPGGLQEDAISIVSSPVINLRLHASS